MLIALLWLAGACLRVTILAVPPLLPRIRDELGLSAAAVGLLVTLPAALFALAALPGARLIARVGAKRGLVLGLAVVALGAALRGTSTSAAALFATTMVMGTGVAVMQPAMPTVVREWLPGHVGFGTAVYTNGLLVGELAPVSLTIPFILPLVDESWRAALAVWAVPVALTVLLVVAFGPRTDRHVGGRGAVAWWPNWRDPLVWQLGVLFGSINSLYFATNAFLPGYLTAAGRADLVSGALTALNVSQVPASLLLLMTVRRLQGKAWPYALAGALLLTSVVGIMSSTGEAVLFWAGLLGFCDSAALTLALTIPPLVSPPQEVARTSAAMFTLSYGSAVVIATASGAAWDALGTPVAAFTPIAACGLAMALAALALRRRSNLT